MIADSVSHDDDDDDGGGVDNGAISCKYVFIKMIVLNKWRNH